MKKFSTVIFLGPGTNLSPILTRKSPKFVLPILNESLLSINIKWIRPVSSRIFIVVLEKFKDVVNKIADSDDIEIITVKDYEGTFTTLKILKEKLDDYILIYKGDIVTDMPAVEITKEFKYTGKCLALFTESQNLNELIVHDGNSLFYYDEIKGNETNVMYSLYNDHPKCRFTLGLTPLQFYILGKELLDMSFTDYSFKNKIFPQIINLVRKTCPVKIYIPNSYKIYRIDNFKDYIKVNQIKKLEMQFTKWSLDSKESCSEFVNTSKKRVSFEDGKDFKKTIVGTNFNTTNKSNLLDTIVGNNVTIGDGSNVSHSILMDNVTVGSNCILENCIVGFSVLIPENSILKDCKIPADYVFNESINATKKNFILEEYEEN